MTIREIRPSVLGAVLSSDMMIILGTNRGWNGDGDELEYEMFSLIQSKEV